MTTGQFCLAVGIASATVACSTVERSRNVADPNVKGKVLAEQVCSNCHGLDGNPVSPAFPRLAGQQAEYIRNQLKAFRNHTRSDPAAKAYMWGLTRSLTDEQIAGLGEYYANQTPAANRAVDPERLVAGREIFEKGVAGGKVVPACSQCHGPQAQGDRNIPRLANQHADYILKQLAVFQQNNGRTQTPMELVVREITEDEKRAVAAYLQSFAPRTRN